MFTVTVVNAQEACCPEFKLVSDMMPCPKYKEPYNGSSPHEKCDISACKLTEQNYTVYPSIPGYTYTWAVTGGTAATSTGNPMKVTWGNGDEASIKVFITNQNGTCKDTISVKGCLKDAPVANFSFNPASPVCLNQSMQFTNSSTGALSYYWDFGDGTTSTQVNPIHNYTTPGTYTITLTVSNGNPYNSDYVGPVQEARVECGCKDTITKTITVKGESGITIVPGCKQMLCKGDKASYSTSNQCNNYNWSVTGGHIEGGNNGSSIDVVWDGNYPATVTMTGNCGGTCGNSGTLNVPVLYPTMPIVGNNIVCPSAFTTYSLPSMPGTNYAWTLSGGGTISGANTDTSVINVQWGNTTGNYTITCNYKNPITKCSGTANISVQILPPYKISGPTKFCVNDAFTFNANGNGNWTISPSAGFTPNSFTAGSSINGVWTTPGNYTITATPTTPTNFCSYPATVDIVVYDKPKLNAIVGPTSICPGSTQLYSVSSNMNDGMFFWPIVGGTVVSYTGSHHESVMIQWNAIGPYQVVVNQTVEGCKSADKTVSLVAYPKPEITGAITSCMDNEQIYTATGSAPVGGYVWTLNNGLGTIISGQGTNSVKIVWHGSLNLPNSSVITVTTCGGTDALTVNITASPPVVITKINSLCSSSGISLSSSISGTTYVWDLDGVTLPVNTQTITIQNPGVYTVTVAVANGCKSKGSIVIPEESTSFTANIGATNKTYWLCTETINTNLVATPMPAGSYCYKWFQGSTLTGIGSPVGVTTPNYTATSVGYYWCEVSICGTSCKVVTDRISVRKETCGDSGSCDPDYNPNFTINNSCNPFSFTTTNVPYSSGSAYWYFGDGIETSGSNVTHQYKGIGTYSVCARFGDNTYCAKDICKTVTVNLAANFTASVNCDKVTFTNLCQVQAPATITSYNWSFPGGSLPTSTSADPGVITYAAGGSHTATVTVTDGTTCPISYSVTFTTVSIDAAMNVPTPLCAKTQAPFTATSNNQNLTYQWTFGDGYISNLKDTDHAYASPNTYTVTLTATDINGCSKTDTQTVTVLPEITASIGGDKLICPGSTVTLGVTPLFASYQWFKDGVAILGATLPTYTTGNFGAYWVAVANGDGCATSSNHANVLYSSLPIADIKGNAIQCTNNVPIMIKNSINESGCTYSWTATGPGTVSFSPNNTVFNPNANTVTPGEYQFELTVTNTATGCVAKDTYCITLVQSPTVTVTAPTGQLCEGKAYTFTATASPNINPETYFYKWSNGVSGNTMTTGKPGNYSVMVVNPSGCNATAFAGTIKARPDVSLFPAGCQTLCWTDTLTFPLPTPLPSGAYTITWFDDDGTAVANVGTGLTLPLSNLQPGIHHLYAIVSFAGGCTEKTAIFDLTIRDCNQPIPCDNCTGLLETSSAGASTTITTTTTAQISNNTITFTILKPVKEVRISLSDLKYSWKDPACKNCKLQMLERGCLFASTANQSLGTLNPNISTAANILSGATINECQDELIWNGGTLLQPGTYTIPIQLSLPKPTNDKCVLVIDKLCFHLTLIDEDCKSCETILCKKDVITDSKCVCNDGNNWTGLYLLPSQPGIAVYRNQILCDNTITDVLGNTPYTLSGIYHCKTSCASTVNEITVYNQVNQIIYTLVATAVNESITFPSIGMYTIKLVADCGGNKCVCSFRVNVTSQFEDPEDPDTPDDPNNPSTETITSVIEKIIPPDFNGGILVSKNDKVLYEKYVSYKDKVTSHTAFDLASITKTFTAMAVLKLMEEGKLNVDDAVTKYFPEFPIPEITIKMLLSHRSGLEDYLKFMDESGWDKTKNVANNDILQFIIQNKSKALIHVPDKVFDYSNTNFVLLSLIIEKTSKQSYKDYLSNTFFKPLQMNDTYVLGLDNYAVATKSYYRSGKTYLLRYLDLVYGDKNVYSTVQDLKKWDKALRDGKMFKKATLDLAYAPTSSLTPFVSNYGLGWKKILTTKGNEIIYHTGWWAGNRSLLIRLVKENVMIAVVSNNNFTNIADIKKLCDLFGDYQLSNKKIDNF